MNREERHAAHNVNGTWTPDPDGHLRNVRDKAHYDFAKKVIGNITSRVYLRILDIGCYDGWLDFLLMRHGWVVHGVEFIHNLVVSAKQYAAIQSQTRYKIYEGFFDQVKIDEEYDVVMCFETLEHIDFADVPAHLTKMESLCFKGPESRVIFSLPDQRYEDNAQHLWTPTREVIDELLKQKKGATVEYKAYPGTQIPGNFFVTYIP